MADDKLTGEELTERARELDIEGRSSMDAEALRSAIADEERRRKHAGAHVEGHEPAASPPPDEPENPANSRDPDAEEGDRPRLEGDEATDAELADPNRPVTSVVRDRVPAPPGAHPDTDVPALPAGSRYGRRGYPIVPTDRQDQRDDYDALVNQFVRVVKGEHEGRYGVLLAVSGFASDGYPENGIVQTRDDQAERLVIPYPSLVPALPGGR